MKHAIIFLIYFHTALLASFFEEEDPMHYHHANVITGHLDLNFHDLELKSPIPFSITRNYTSAGALERTYDDTDIHLKNLCRSEWMFQGGWSFLSHTHLLVRGLNAGGNPKAYLRDKNSCAHTTYTHYKKKNGFYYLRPKIKNHRASGSLSSRKNPKNNILKISKRLAILKLADGTERHYSGNLYTNESYWQLDLEILPSKHRIAYFYSNEKKPIQIQLQNPEGTKAFATIDFDDSSYKTDNTLRAKTSDGRTLEYQIGTEFKQRTYHDKAKAPNRPQETYHYQPGRKGIGARIGGMSFGNKEEFQVEYHLPKDDRKGGTWAENPSAHVSGDKVKCLKFPDPRTGEFVTVATFEYFPRSTEITDHEGNWTVYNYDKEKLLSIHHHDRNRILHSRVEFEWEDGNLTEKKLLNPAGHVLFSKTFIYDAAGNIIDEIWKDHISHLNSVHRKFTYSKYRMVLSDEEVGGLSHQYEYLPHSDLMTKRLTLHKGKILLREFFKYDKDNLLIQTITDDGSQPNFGHSSGVTERKIQTFDLDPETGLCKRMSAFAFDLKKCTKCLIQKNDYTYNEKREIIADTISYGNSNETHTLHMEYDDQGRLIKKTSPLGRQHLFTYDESGNLLESKEPGTPLKHFEYDHGNRPKTCIENGKTTHSSYDIKGRLIAQTDRYGNTVHQNYDCFGNCTETRFPKSQNTEGKNYIPKAIFSYDIQGNILTTTNPRKETISTEYNILRKPTRITNPDGTTLLHEYNNQGSISKTVYPDQTEIRFIYDPFQRMTSKVICSPNGEILSEETWTYNTFHLLSYTDPMGFKTHYQYDIMGRKIAETANDRTTTFAYDVFGFLEKVTQDGFSKTERHNCEGQITQQWEEDSQGTCENHMFFEYDSEGRKQKAIRITSQGEAEDHFFYDEEGHLAKHTDPHGESSQFLYAETLNALGQIVEQKTTIDPLGNATIETYDANHRLVSMEKKDPDDQTVSSEELFYDEAGNRTKRLTTIYEKNAPLRHYTTTWLYNENGQPIQEIEEDQKCTSFSYDTRGPVLGDSSFRILPGERVVIVGPSGVGKTT
ncbi:MAG: putative deoxyribonuclease RhsC, partial [Chlamydiae bacterium]|nr:putative deoxyribonuclease RhsC [Chlamydiota bacterium]